MPENLGEKLKTWRTLAEGIKPRLEEIPLLREDQAELAALVLEIDALIDRGDQHEARLRETSRKRTQAEARAAELHGRVVFVLKGHYGKRALLLHEFGVQPHALPGPKKEETTPPAPTPAPASQEPTPDSGA